MRKFFILFITLWLCLFTVGISTVWAWECGGQVQINYSGSWFEDGTYISSLHDSLEMEVFVPAGEKAELSYAFQVDNLLQGLTAPKKIDYFTKKLYLKLRLVPFHLTIGRQPISWAFGSLLNPVDYSLGIEAINEESGSKYTDAIEIYTPLGWNSGLTLVTSFPGGFEPKREKMKWGIRGRFGIKGYDLTLNYVKEATGFFPLLPQQRIGVTFKGDLGKTGIYGAYGHYFGGEVKRINSYLLGMDYSYNINYDHKLILQLEVLALEGSELALFPNLPLMTGSGKDQTLLLTSSIAYPLDDFSILSLLVAANPAEQKLMIIPGYQTTLSQDLDLIIRSHIACGKGWNACHPQGAIMLGLSYPF